MHVRHCFNLGQWTELNGVAVLERRLPDSGTDLQRWVVGVVDVSLHVFGIGNFRKQLKFPGCIPNDVKLLFNGLNLGLEFSASSPICV